MERIEWFGARCRRCRHERTDHGVPSFCTVEGCGCVEFKGWPSDDFCANCGGHLSDHYTTTGQPDYCLCKPDLACDCPQFEEAQQ